MYEEVVKVDLWLLVKVSLEVVDGRKRMEEALALMRGKAQR